MELTRRAGRVGGERRGGTRLTGFRSKLGTGGHSMDTGYRFTAVRPPR